MERQHVLVFHINEHMVAVCTVEKLVFINMLKMIDVRYGLVLLSLKLEFLCVL